MYRKWTNYEIEYLKCNYPSCLIKDISLYLNRTPKSIMLKAHKLGIKKEVRDSSNMYTYHVDKDYFKNINTPNKAYYLGWAVTDGNYLFEKNNHQYRLRLHSRDEDILHKFLSDINSNTIIYKRGNYSEVNICDRDFVNNLTQYGFCNNKTKSIKYPDIPKEFDLDFIKGCFDGDGSYICTKKTHKISFVSASKYLFYQLISKLNSYQIIVYPNIQDTYYSFEISKIECIKNFINLMLYTESDFLNRKHNKMIELYNFYNN